ncbi:MAG: Autoinducer 2 import ATP-binding protein LsrA [Fimbriimonadaceae bacterium]|nr:Autoinducer 2 import ATP-binding protein LsrA [Fimbriimonadaceae bacterium]
MDGVSTSCASGEIHAIVGENGAGKSTLMQILGGFVAPDAGRVVLDGVPLPVGDPIGCRARGIRMVHQHFMLVPSFSVRENLVLDGLSTTGSPEEGAEAAIELGRRLGWEIDPKARVAELPVGVQQRVEILKAIVGDSPVTIFDEPTAVLTADEVADLFGVLRTLRGEGRMIIFIAHKIDEIRGIADRVTVLRRGKVTLRASMAETSNEDLIRAMVGDLPPELAVDRKAPGRKELLVANGVVIRGDRGERAVDGVTLGVAAGEILGIGGVDGNGQVELAEALVGIRKVEAGTVRLGGDHIAYIPQDRQRDGLALSLSIRDNLLLGGYARPEFYRGPWMSAARVNRWADDLIERFQIKVGQATDPASSLSGGNQQKVVVARALASNPQVLVVVNPTRGLDVQAAAYVHQAMTDAAANGAGIVLFSTDLDELALLANRTLFMSRGRLGEARAEKLVGG